VSQTKAKQKTKVKGKKGKKQKFKLAKCGWLTPIILATQEAAMRRIEI
jgi:hypothetical protein